MKCPKCSHKETAVVDSRVTREGREIRRRRTCGKCGHRFTTYERMEERAVFIVKRDKRREPFSREKVMRGMVKACEKLDVPTEQVELAVNRIARLIMDMNMAEVKSSVVGNLVMEELKNLDEVAYIRFASVYKRFKDVSEFTSHIEEIRQDRGASMGHRDHRDPPKSK